MFKIFKVLGTPTETTWPGVTQLPDFKVSFPKFTAKPLGSVAKNLDASGLDLLQ